MERLKSPQPRKDFVIVARGQLVDAADRGLLEIPLGVIALADPGATLTALILVAGIWAVAIGVTRVAMSFELKRLPRDVDKAFAAATNGTGSRGVHAGNGQPAPAAH